MEVHIYSAKDNSQAGNMSQRYSVNTKRSKPKKNQLGILKKIMHFARKFSRGPQVQERTLLGREHLPIYENTPI